MISRKTVLILGAGASEPYGYPTGPGLKREVLESLTSHLHRFEEMTPGLYEGSRQKVQEFSKALHYSAATSVDAFLEHRPEFVDVGKVAIAHIMLSKENREDLFKPNDGRWYHYLFERLNASFDSFQSNQLGVLTFNYDRSLEYFLHMAITNLYGRSEEACVKKLRSIPVVHLYGQVGLLPWQGGGDTIPYGGFAFAKNDYERRAFIANSAKTIQIIHDKLGPLEGTHFYEANRIISEADWIYFLGFGYNATNLKRLACNQLPSKQVFGTAYQLETSERRIVEKDLTNLSLWPELADMKTDCLLFLRRDAQW